jgi:hypothetical protein
MQDGILAHYLEQASAADVNVEARIEREWFDFQFAPREGAKRCEMICRGPAVPPCQAHSVAFQVELLVP